MIYTLVLLVCVAGSSAPCQVHEEQANDLSASPSTAFVQAQTLVAQWLESHPGYEIQDWRLKPGKGA
ncbi:hypothetical protein SAMN06265365_14412 [Tistlia consotensis]|uniref:Uncharacterized protein n=1 Tax=Tistlia consotensis USBA 355 TaxID=560819 RepID=A0A1Y6CQY6_9PROT|nr:hypothetical protein [Tistlia consotensis]SMF82400.1 hypothetical protein SAMN05428998_14626 [Tistlia consotensis USBA 355]SNS27330.1 hypothetical protein SAMN06265365_14412 [Tistlia consotensis]